jgi:hypothetical protein
MAVAPISISLLEDEKWQVTGDYTPASIKQTPALRIRLLIEADLRRGG